MQSHPQERLSLIYADSLKRIGIDATVRLVDEVSAPPHEHVDELVQDGLPRNGLRYSHHRGKIEMLDRRARSRC